MNHVTQSDITFRMNTKSLIDCTYNAFDFYWERDDAEISVFCGSTKLPPLQVRAKAGFVTFTPVEARKAIVNFCKGIK